MFLSHAIRKNLESSVIPPNKLKVVIGKKPAFENHKSSWKN